jgi:hypothetical protein
VDTSQLHLSRLQFATTTIYQRRDHECQADGHRHEEEAMPKTG